MSDEADVQVERNGVTIRVVISAEEYLYNSIESVQQVLELTSAKALAAWTVSR